MRKLGKGCVAFALDRCGCEAIAQAATTEGIKSEDVQDLILTSVENRFGRINIASLQKIPYRQSTTLARSRVQGPYAARVNRNGRRLRQNPQARLCFGQPIAGRHDRHREIALMVRTI